MAHDEQHFSRAEEFIPERWLRSEPKDVNPFSMLPFGFGSRMCVGRRIAEQELYLALIRVSFIPVIEKKVLFSLTEHCLFARNFSRIHRK